MNIEIQSNTPDTQQIPKPSDGAYDAGAYHRFEEITFNDKKTQSKTKQKPNSNRNRPSLPEFWSNGSNGLTKEHIRIATTIGLPAARAALEAAKANINKSSE